jgi:hypothetical protein
MSRAEVITLINIVSQLAEVIQASVEASDDAQVKAAWVQAQAMFNKGFEAAYGNPDKA